jgi:hypothetical protein
MEHNIVMITSFPPPSPPPPPPPPLSPSPLRVAFSDPSRLSVNSETVNSDIYQGP